MINDFLEGVQLIDHWVREKHLDLKTNQNYSCLTCSAKTQTGLNSQSIKGWKGDIVSSATSSESRVDTQSWILWVQSLFISYKESISKSLWEMVEGVYRVRKCISLDAFVLTWVHCVFPNWLYLTKGNIQMTNEHTSNNKSNIF